VSTQSFRGTLRAQGLLGPIFFFIGSFLVASGIGLLTLPSVTEYSMRHLVLVALILVLVGITVMIMSAFSLLPRLIVVQSKEDIYQFLNENERMLLELLVERGELSHADIMKITGFSRAKVSRILKKLEHMRLIIQVRQGKKKVARVRKEVARVLKS